MDPRYNPPPYGPPPGQPGGHPHQPYAQAPYPQGPYGQGAYPQPGYAQPYPPQYHPAAYPHPGVGPDAQQMMLYDANKKSAMVAYALWFFLGMFGAHRFYLDRSGSGAAQLLLTIGSFILLAIVIGAFSLLAVAVWVLVDAFMIPDWVREYNNRLIARMNYR